MSKIICDVCGTVFPETDSKCPVCGCAKSPLAQPAVEESQFDTVKSSTGAYAKGGRFAKDNGKHTPAFAASKTSKRRKDNSSDDKEPKENNKVLVIVVIVLLLAIVAVVAYIGVSVFFGDAFARPGGNQTTEATEESTEATELQIPCTDLQLDKTMIHFDKENMSHLFNPTILPADTTDIPVYSSSDTNVAIVDQNGQVIPVGYGEAVITVTCGDISKECTVLCTFGEAEPTEETTQPVGTAPVGFVLKLIYDDITISQKYPDPVKIYKEIDGVKASDITWSVEDPAIASVKDGVVTGINKGNTKVTAIIGDQVVECIVRCYITAPDPTETTGITISSTDVTLYSGKGFYLTLTNGNGSRVQGIEWKASVEGLVEIDGNNITALNITEKKIIEVYTEHEGVKYACTVRLYPPKAE